MCSGGAVQTIQTVEWQGLGPHFWAGPLLSTEDATLGFGVLTVSCFDAQGGDVGISNLEQPVTLGLPLTQMSRPVNGSVARCSYWDDTTQQWVVDGQCTLKETSDGLVVDCSVTHRLGRGKHTGTPYHNST